MAEIERFSSIETACRDEVVVRYRRQVAALLEEPTRRALQLFRGQSAKLACLLWSADGIDAMGIWTDEQMADSELDSLKPYVLCFVGPPMEPLSEVETWIERTIGNVTEEAVISLFKPQKCYVPTYLMDAATRNEIIERANIRGADDWFYLTSRRWLVSS